MMLEGSIVVSIIEQKLQVMKIKEKIITKQILDHR